MISGVKLELIQLTKVAAVKSLLRSPGYCALTQQRTSAAGGGANACYSCLHTFGWTDFTLSQTPHTPQSVSVRTGDNSDPSKSNFYILCIKNFTLWNKKAKIEKHFSIFFLLYVMVSRQKILFYFFNKSMQGIDNMNFLIPY